ncbi:hypothetical protein [Ralstonia pseudosolanacearum]|uniref:hypothetical protein n=1 Tax=Ralstonia pseudosolanacearum TaxID=1310165 RepID=UPI0011CDB307|nr:hypothetical protein [Ralstonia pseudosolanacearum]
MKREQWVYVGAGSGATGAALYAAQGNTVGVLIFGVILVASILAARTCDRKLTGQSDSAVE